jgi:hypothetical protein
MPRSGNLVAESARRSRPRKRSGNAAGADLLELDALPPAATPGPGPEGAGEPALTPAPLSRYRDLTSLRYDFPVILAGPEAEAGQLRSLTGIIDEILRDIAPRGIAGERLRKQVLRLEREIRTLAFRGAEGSLAQLWDLAQNHLLSDAVEDAERQSLGDSLSRARRALRFDGEVVDCGAETPRKLLIHLWRVVEAKKARKFLARLDRLALKLSEILKADFMKSEQGHAPDFLQRSVGTTFEAAFDFEAMSHILGSAAPGKLLAKSRRQRIRTAHSILQSQRFLASARARPEESEDGDPPAYDFVFGSCAGALSAFRDRLPEMVELIKAVAIAELEIENQYKDSIHGPAFSRFNEGSLVPEDLAPFPSYLVCLRDGDCEAAERAALVEALSSGLSVKILVQSDDILEELSVAAGRFTFGAKGSQLASMAVGLNTAYVLQSSGSHLYQARDRILKGLAYDGPALFSVFSGASGSLPALAPYLAAAVAMESRAFPSFSYDPGAGQDWASRFCVDDNPQVEASWPTHSVLYEDQDHQGVSEEAAITFADFVACDARYAGRFATVPRDAWHDGMVPLGRFLERQDEDASAGSPYILLADENNVARRALVDDSLIDAARRCRQMWRSLQELGGVDSSHAKRLVERERQLWNQEKERELEELEGRLGLPAEAPTAAPDATPGAVPSQAASEVAVEVPEQPEEPPSEEPYIETPRCTTCNECTDINNKLFAYDENMQAYIADPDAGPYRDLVEAAESCQVCILHPGKPKNPNEPNLDELIKRAQPFI